MTVVGGKGVQAPSSLDVDKTALVESVKSLLAIRAE